MSFYNIGCNCTVTKWHELETLHSEITSHLSRCSEFTEFIKTFPQPDGEVLYLFGQMFIHQNMVKDFTEFEHLLIHLSNFEFMVQTNSQQTQKGLTDYLIRLKAPLLIAPVVLLLQASKLQHSDFLQAIQRSPIGDKVCSRHFWVYIS